MPQGIGYGTQAGQADQSGGLPMSEAQKMALQQMSTQQRPFGWLMDMIGFITGSMSSQQNDVKLKPGSQGPQQQQQTGQQPTKANQGRQGQGPGQKPGGQGGPKNAKAGQQQSVIDPREVQALVQAFQQNSLSNLGMLPQQQGNSDMAVFLALLQQQQARQAQQRALMGNDLISIFSQLGNAGIGQQQTQSLSSGSSSTTKKG